MNHTLWSEIPLSFYPLSITASDETLWLCGNDETVVSSVDAGRTWTVRHQILDGETLLKIAFINGSVGHAAGTGGRTLTTEDDGKTWIARGTGKTIQQFSFADALHGIAEIDHRLALTADGGEHWKVVEALDREYAANVPQIESVAAVDATHFAAAINEPNKENFYLSTSDGGITWAHIHLANTFAGTLFAHNGEYWAFGIEYLGREHDPAGGYSAAVTLHSPDGKTWQHGVRAVTEFTSCTVQGCALSYGVIQSLYGKDDEIWSVPQNHPLGNQWAMVRERICTLSDGLKCGEALSSAAPQPMPENTIQVQHLDASDTTFAPDCLQCAVSSFRPTINLPNGGGIARSISAELKLRGNGSVESVNVDDRLVSAMRSQLSKEIAAWLFEPPHKNDIHRKVIVDLYCFGFPGKPETMRCSISPTKHQP